MPGTIQDILSQRLRLKNTNDIRTIFQIDLFRNLTRKYADGVFEGGGSLGLAYSGALRVLEDNNIWFKRLVGNSAGAITASMIAVGFTAKEIQWLTSSFAPSPPVPTSLSGLFTPIDFNDLIDPPNKNSLTQVQKRGTFLWKLLQINILNNIENIRLPIPTKKELLDNIMASLESIPTLRTAMAISGVKDDVRGALTPLMLPLPSDVVKIKSFIDTRNLRSIIADAVFDVILASSPQITMMLNLIHAGGLFDGDKLLSILRKYFGLKKFRDENAQVKFSDLAIPLAVIGTNISTGKMEIFSAQTHPSMEVALAVRISMSVPFAFKPVSFNNSMYVDGGLTSNYPLFLLSDAGDSYWRPTDIDRARPKIGFIVDETVNAGQGFNPPRFRLTSGRIDKKILYKELLMQILRKSGYDIPDIANPFQSISDTFIKEFIAILSQNMPCFMHELFGCMNISSENSIRSFINKSLMQGHTYYEIVIPLLGYDGADFNVNRDSDATLAMWERAWDAARRVLTQSINNQPAMVDSNYLAQNPYH